MTIGVNNRMDYVGSASTDTYAYSFKIFAASDLLVTQRDTDDVETTLSYPGDFSVTGVGVAAGGSIVLADGDLPQDYALTIRRVRSIAQTTDIRNQSQVFNDVLEDTYDSLVMIDQQQQDELNRSIKLPETVSGDDVDTMLPVPEALALLGWNADGDGLVNFTGTIDVLVSAFGEAFVATASAAAARTALGAGAVGGPLFLTATAAAARAAIGSEHPLGQCRFAKSGANLVLSRHNGQWLMINGVWQSIPSAGVSLAPSGLTGSTAYYIYAFMSGATMTLEQSTTAPAVDTTTGLKIKTADATRTLVGQAVASGASAWSTNPLEVLSFFNRRPLTDKKTFTANRVNSATSPTYAETNSEIRVPFICWSDDVVEATFQGQVTQATINGISYGAIGYNTTSVVEDGVAGHQAYGANAISNTHNFAPKSGLAEATLHYATQLGTNVTGNGTWAGSASAATRCSLQVILNG